MNTNVPQNDDQNDDWILRIHHEKYTKKKTITFYTSDRSLHTDSVVKTTFIPVMCISIVHFNLNQELPVLGPGLPTQSNQCYQPKWRQVDRRGGVQEF